jgi:hypothetical protein
MSSDSNDSKSLNNVTNVIEIVKLKKNFNPKTLLEPPLEILAKAAYT